MINRLHVFKHIPKSQEFPNVAKLEIHLGLSLHKASDSRQPWTSDRPLKSPRRKGHWTKYILQILDDVKPYLVHIHYNGADDSLPVESVNALKAEQHVVQRQPGAWKIWSR